MNQWLPFLGGIVVNLIVLAFFFGKNQADMRAMKLQLDTLMLAQREDDKTSGAVGVRIADFVLTKAMTDCHHARIAAIEKAQMAMDSRLTERFNEVFRWLSAIAKGDMPITLPSPPG